MKTVLRSIAIAVMHVACVITAQTQAQTLAGPNRPSTVPEGFVITPFGYFHPSCINQLARGDVLRSDQHVVQHPDGTTSPIPACAYPHYKPNGERVSGDEPGPKPLDTTGWLESASVSTTSSFAVLSAQWSVPYAPTANDGQTLYYFPGLEDNQTQTTTILQPVLAWNDPALPSTWSITSWNCCIDNKTVAKGTPQLVNPGDTIFGDIGCAAGGNPCPSWNVVTTDLQNGKSSQLLGTSNNNLTFNWAFGGVLEVWYLKQCADFPSNYYMSFNNIQLANNLGQPIPNPNWSVSTPSSTVTPQCNYSVNLSTQVILEAAP